LVMDQNDFNPLIVHCYYAIFVIFALSENGLLIYLIRFRSPHIVRSLKAMLINISTMQILTATMAGLLQGRLIGYESSLAILPEGPLRMFGPRAGLIGYSVISAFTFYVELLIAHTMYWRYRMLQARQMNKAELLLSFTMIGIWPVLLVVLPHIGPPQFDIIMNEVVQVHPNYNLKKYGEFGGFDSKTLNQTIWSFIGSAITIISPILILYLRRLILKTLNNSNHQYTTKTIQSSQMYLRALTMQAMVPVLCFVPSITLANLARVSGSNSPISEYLRICIATLPCVIDPLIAFYFVPPYRAWILKKFFPTEAGTKNVTTVTRNRNLRVQESTP
uniref:G protein-coupled receptor n=1 Tax=Haemonchus contortus TaxID=6289 RepID=A0A7I4Y9Y6_HAECO